MILSDASEMIYERAAISIASLPCKVKDYIGDVSHYLGDALWDTDKSKELCSDFLPLDAAAVEQPSRIERVHKIGLGVATALVSVFGGVYPMHR